MEPDTAEPMLWASMEQEDRVFISRQTSRNSASATRNPFLCRMTNRPACSAFFFDGLCRLAGLGSMACGLCRMPSRLTGALGGGIFLLMACFCCQRERGLLASWGFSARDFWYRALMFAFSSFCSALAASR